MNFARMFAMDGNNSLKRMQGVGNRQQADTRVFGDSDYFLSEDYVNTFANEVPPRKSSARQATVESDNEADSAKPTAGGFEDGDPVGDCESTLHPGIRHCTDNWRAAASDTTKKHAWDGFRECGIFAGACRHGFILWIADMVRSGELYVVLLHIYHPYHFLIWISQFKVSLGHRC